MDPNLLSPRINYNTREIRPSQPSSRAPSREPSSRKSDSRPDHQTRAVSGDDGHGSDRSRSRADYTGNYDTIQSPPSAPQIVLDQDYLDDPEEQPDTVNQSFQAYQPFLSPGGSGYFRPHPWSTPSSMKNQSIDDLGFGSQNQMPPSSAGPHAPSNYSPRYASPNPGFAAQSRSPSYTRLPPYDGGRRYAQENTGYFEFENGPPSPRHGPRISDLGRSDDDRSDESRGRRRSPRPYHPPVSNVNIHTELENHCKRTSISTVHFTMNRGKGFYWIQPKDCRSPKIFKPEFGNAKSNIFKLEFESSNQNHSELSSSRNVRPNEDYNSNNSDCYYISLENGSAREIPTITQKNSIPKRGRVHHEFNFGTPYGPKQISFSENQQPLSFGHTSPMNEEIGSLNARSGSLDSLDVEVGDTTETREATDPQSGRHDSVRAGNLGVLDVPSDSRAHQRRRSNSYDPKR
ncbi:uncharacterized protein I206_102691 [Kwoniella pini CBS 10737]|uniref:Uncharacterized protein n=1 Tax=Kwoniella pini CBS 10737 TaxID=1296096 RepID=A0A1B9I646_9TREE|nr:uncharacterized protein I206_03044 [Kwoniella pini CBS 10737]OCF50982.1 hypothetical protein I206_03044 [Kwoniella pini CBS 10737]